MMALRDNDSVPHSDDLRKIIESYGWTLYELSKDPDKNEPIDFESRGVAKGDFKIGKDYLFIPIYKSGTLEEAFEQISVREASGPALDLDGVVVPFTRIEFMVNGAIVMSPPPLHPGAFLFYCDDGLINDFKRGFFIQSRTRRRKFDPLDN